MIKPLNWSITIVIKATFFGTNHYSILCIPQKQRRTHFKTSCTLTFTDFMRNTFIEFLHQFSLYGPILEKCKQLLPETFAKNFHLFFFRQAFSGDGRHLLRDVLYPLDLQEWHRHTVQSQVYPSPYALLILAAIWDRLWPNLNCCNGKKTYNFLFFIFMWFFSATTCKIF